MTATNELIEKMNTFIQEEIEENRLSLLVDEEITEIPEKLELIEIETSFIEAEDGTNEYDIYINTFQAGDRKIVIDVFAEDTYLEEEVYLRGSYKVTWDSFNGSSMEPLKYSANASLEGGDIAKLLNEINYSEAFNDDGSLLLKVCDERLETQSKKIFEKAKGVFSDLVAIEAGGSSHADMVFESGAVLSVKLSNIYEAIEKVNQKKAEKQQS